jgi:mono/diheme cytochrome c family protein
VKRTVHRHTALPLTFKENRVKPRRFRIFIAALALACSARIVTSAQANPEAAKVKNPVAATPESIAAGKAVYTKCAPCHGVRGDGGPGNDLIPAAPSLVDAMWDHGSTDGEIFDSIKNGVAPDFNMVPFKDQLKDQEIWHVVNYLRSIAKEK